jgi:hypothetical protein
MRLLLIAIAMVIWPLFLFILPPPPLSLSTNILMFSYALIRPTLTPTKYALLVIMKVRT